MKRVLSLVLALSLLSFECEPDIEFLDNQRLLFKGLVTDVMNGPAGNIPVEIYASRDFFYPSYSYNTRNDELLAKGLTDANGTFSLIGLSPSNAFNIYARINFDTNSSSVSSTPIVINSINFLDRNDFTYDLESLAIENVNNFNFRIERSTNTTDTLIYSLRYKSEIKSIDFDVQNTLYPILPSCCSLSNEVLPSDDFEENLLNLRETDTIFMQYRLVNGMVRELDSLEIVVNENQNGFVFSF